MCVDLVDDPKVTSVSMWLGKSEACFDSTFLKRVLRSTARLTLARSLTLDTKVPTRLTVENTHSRVFLNANLYQARM